MTPSATVTSRQAALSDGLRLLVFGRVVPATFFAVLGYIQLSHLISNVQALPNPVTVASILGAPVPAGLYLLFCAIPVFIYVNRPAPRARDGRVLPRVAGLLGTTMLLVVGVVPHVVLLYTVPAWLDGVSTAVSIGAFSLAVYGLLYLRRSLSLIPEARRLVTGGPYQAVRHPLYAAEILAAAAFTMANPGIAAMAALLPFVAVQLVRARYEERLLGQTFPDYAAYAARTRRLIPFVW